MNLNDALKECLKKGYKEIKIGAKVNFIYCGLLNKNTKKIISDLSHKEQKNVRRKMITAKKHIKNLDTTWARTASKYYNQFNESVKNKKQPMYKKKRVNSYEELESLIAKDKVKDIILTNKRIDRCKIILDDWKTFLKREVIDMYEFNDGSGIILIIQGQEQGDYWTIEEYNKKQEKEYKA